MGIYQALLSSGNAAEEPFVGQAGGRGPRCRKCSDWEKVLERGEMSKRFFCNENILSIFLAFVLSRSPMSLWLLGLAPHMGQVVHAQGTPYVRSM